VGIKPVLGKPELSSPHITVTTINVRHLLAMPVITARCLKKISNSL